MRQYFNTKEAAERNLEIRRKLAYKRIEKKEWKILSDTSFVYCDYKWDKARQTKSGLWVSSQTTTLKWYNTLMIVTDEMIKDLSNMQLLDTNAELEAIMSGINIFKKNQNDNIN